VIRIYSFSWKILRKLYVLIDACFVGFCLGILNRETLHLIDQSYYDNTKMYHDEAYNRGGLWSWEKEALNTYFQTCRYLLVAGVGGGREVLALHPLGYEVDGFECNPRLVEGANALLKKEGLMPSIQLAPRDGCPDATKIYDGIVVGWGAYMLIQGRKHRIAFLQQLRKQTREGSPVLLSFFYRSGTERRFKVIAAIGNVMRWLLRRERLQRGDDLVPNCVHSFTREEIASELCEGGFQFVFYSTAGYGHAVGIAS